MSDQGFYQRNINAGGTALQNTTEAGNIASTSTVVAGDTSGGAYTIRLPEQSANAGRTVTVVNVDGSDILTVGVQVGDRLGALLDGSTPIPAVALSYRTFFCTGFAWVIAI